MRMLTVDYLKSILHYDPETGRWSYLVSTSYRNVVGGDAGFINGQGYRIIKIKGRAYKAHRLAIFYMTGQWPDSFVDHRDMNRSNNRWGNIRQATPSQNQVNTRLRSDNKTGYKGVGWHKRDKIWSARIGLSGRLIHLGNFQSKEEARGAYEAAALRYFGDYARVA